MSEVKIIRTTDGEERETILFEDGSWSCPFCLCPTWPAPPGTERMWPYPCDNPACIAGGRGKLENVLAARQQWAKEKEAREAKRRLELSNEQTRTERERAAQEAQDAFREEAGKQGLCMDCWNHSTDYGRFLRHAVRIRHRAPANCPQDRKRQRARS